MAQGSELPNGHSPHLHVVYDASEIDSQASSDEPHVLVRRIDGPAERRAELAAGLLAQQARISPKFFYDEQGCAIYESICALDEYYPPRTEAAIFARNQDDIVAALPSRSQFVDLGCGDGVKATRWIEALDVSRYTGVDIAEAWLRDTLRRGAKRYPGVVFDGVVTDFTRGLALQPLLAPDLPKVFFYPGSSIGNFDPEAALRLLREIRQHLLPTDRLLIGVDAPKPVGPLVAAYDDAIGVTASFNRNVLRVVNRELGSNFDIADFTHRAIFNTAASRVEMHLVARRDVQVQWADNGSRKFRSGESIVTEHSHKHTPSGFMQLLSEAGFGDVRHWTDDQHWYGVYVAAPGAWRQ